MDNDFRGFSLFNDVENVSLRTYNRCMMFFNIFRDQSKEMAVDYLKQLDDIGKAQVGRLLDRIKTEGLSRIQQEVRGEV